MNLNQWFDEGMDPNTYVESMTEHQDGLLHIYESFTPPEDSEFNKNLYSQNLRVIILTEDWCGDAMLNVPILFRMAEQVNMPVKLLLRDENLELMDHYLTNGRSRSIPIFIFIDEAGNEVASWGPRADEIQQFAAESQANLPPKDADGYQEKAREMHLFMSKTFRDDTDFWQIVYTSIRQTLKNALSR
ncbi:thioredoxin family protein [Barrientosiimonas marina]|uniref:Thioredoxin family protein n=1 Tax=Lentibacillus kimchii TaxID=1542911 RepID=A0ABW2URU7_9BACI